MKLTVSDRKEIQCIYYVCMWSIYLLCFLSREEEFPVSYIQIQSSSLCIVKINTPHESEMKGVISHGMQIRDNRKEHEAF